MMVVVVNARWWCWKSQGCGRRPARAGPAVMEYQGGKKPQTAVTECYGTTARPE